MRDGHDSSLLREDAAFVLFFLNVLHLYWWGDGVPMIGCLFRGLAMAGDGMRAVMELHCLELYVVNQLRVIEVRINSSISLGKSG